MEEASELMKNLDSIPGMKNMQKMMEGLGLDIGNNKINIGATKQKMKTNLQRMQTKNRMNKKLEKKKNVSQDDQITSLERQLAEARSENAKNKLLNTLDNETPKRKKKGKRNRKK